MLDDAESPGQRNNVVRDIIDNTNRSLTPLFFASPKDSPLEKASGKIHAMINEEK